MQIVLEKDQMKKNPQPLVSLEYEYSIFTFPVKLTIPKLNPFSMFCFFWCEKIIFNYISIPVFITFFCCKRNFFS